MWYFGSEVVKIDPAGHFVFSGVRGSRSGDPESARRWGREDGAPRGEDVSSSQSHARGKPHQSCPAAVFSPMFDGVSLHRVLCHLSGEAAAVCVEGDKVTHRFTPACRWTPVKPVSQVMRTQSSIHRLNSRIRSRKQRMVGLSGKRICIAICVRTLWSVPPPDILSVSLSSPAMMPEPVHSFQGQKFHKLRRACLHRGVLFKDPLFPATAQSLFYRREPPPGLTWKRPKVRWKWVDGVAKNRGHIQIRPRRDN